MAWSLSELTDALVIQMVDNSRYPVLAGQAMPTSMRDEMEDSMGRMSNAIYHFVESFVLDPATIENTYQVKTDQDDLVPGYLEDKIDDDTIQLDPVTRQIYVATIPLASASQVGGVQVGAQSFLYMQGDNLMLNAETSATLVGGNDMVPTSRAVKNYVDAIITAQGGGGDMLKSTYDTGDNGVVDNSERLNNQLPSYYLAWANLTGVPTTVSGYGITDVYTETEIDAFFEGESAGKKQVAWSNITGSPTLYAVANPGANRVITSESTYAGNAEANLTFDGSALSLTGSLSTVGEVYLTTITGTGTGTSILYYNRTTGQVTYGDQPSGGGTFTGDISVILSGGKSLGQYTNGDTIPSDGLTAEEVIELLATEYIDASFTAFSVTGQATTVEVGTTLSGTRTFTWTIDDGSGQVNTLDIYDITDASDILTATTNDGSEVGTLNTLQLNSEGATQQWRGVGTDVTPDPDVDFNSNTFTVTGRFYRWWDADDTSVTDSASVRALTNSDWQTGTDVFILNTGTTASKFQVCLPPGVTILSVIDLDALNLDITSEYVAQSNINVLDAGGTNRSYNIYEMDPAIPYASNHQHQITAG